MTLMLTMLSAAALAAQAEERPSATSASTRLIEEIVVTARRDSYPELDAATLTVRNLHLDKAVKAILAATLEARS